uniref:Uncharacterized protein n=1 Tax=Timema genevievae TaxID=629358 RepID=A0A7R9K5P4_TIMGE|nr:unnamed protein product [Timema genevievae]
MTPGYSPYDVTSGLDKELRKVNRAHFIQSLTDAVRSTIYNSSTCYFPALEINTSLKYNFRHRINEGGRKVGRVHRKYLFVS